MSNWASWKGWVVSWGQTRKRGGEDRLTCWKFAIDMLVWFVIMMIGRGRGCDERDGEGIWVAFMRINRRCGGDVAGCMEGRYDGWGAMKL